MIDTYRAMCDELAEAYAWCIEEYMTAPAEEDTLIQRARALLAQPVAEGPSDEELDELYFYVKGGHPTPQPVAEGPEGSYFTDGDYNREIHYAWELEDAEGEWQAGGSANRLDDVRREGSHYLQTYSQDGPHKLIIQRHCVSTIEETTND
jgi:hypothetical protein